MYRSHLERLFSLLFRESTRAEHLEKIEKLKNREDKESVSPEQVAKMIFPSDVPDEHLICFLLLVSSGDDLAIRVIEDLGKPFGNGKISVDEAIEIIK